MVRMLGFTEEERARIAASRRGGVLSRVASVPFSVLSALAPGSGGSGGGGAPMTPAGQGDLAEAWVEFLIKQAEGMAAEDAAGRPPEPHAAPEGAPPPPPPAAEGPGLVASLGQYQQRAEAVGQPAQQQQERQPPPGGAQTSLLHSQGESGEQFTSLSLESPTKPPARWLGA